MSGGFIHRKTAGFKNPSTAGYTAETAGLYHYLQALSGSGAWCVGVADYYRITGFAPAWTNYQGQFQTMTGKLPAFLQLEYVDVNDVNSGAVKQANLKADILEVYRTGGFVTLHHHPANPVVGNIANSLAGSTAQNHEDRTGSPVLNCLTGGSRRTEFLAYCDRLATFLNSLTIDDVKVPVIIRWFHEINGGFFWWNGEDRRTDAVQMYKDFIDRLRAQGVTNALFSLNFEISSPVASPSLWYLGDEYLDFVSGDVYGTNAAPTFPYKAIQSIAKAQNYADLLAMGKPFYFAEVGFRYSMNIPPQWSKNFGADMVQFPASSMAGLWMPYAGNGTLNGWSPWVGGGAEADLALMAADPRCITRERTTWRPFVA